MMTGSSDEPSQNFIPTEDPKGSSGEICETGQSGQFVSVRPIDSSTHSPCSFGRNDIDELQTLVPRHAKSYRDVISTEAQGLERRDLWNGAVWSNRQCPAHRFLHSLALLVRSE